MGDGADDALSREECSYDYNGDEASPFNYSEDGPPSAPFKRPAPRIGVAGDGPCPRCGAPVRIRVGPTGKFYGCTKFPVCRGSRSWVELPTNQLPLPKQDASDAATVLARVAKFTLSDGTKVIDRLSPSLRALVELHLPE